MKNQFKLRSIFLLTAMIAILCATYSWLLSDNGYDAFSDIPMLFTPNIVVMLLGILLIPFFCLPLIVFMIIITLRSWPCPYSILIFFGIQLSVFMIDISFWGNGLRLIFAMLLSSMAVVAEVVYRKLTRGQVVVAIMSFFITAAWYVATICLIYSASV